MIKPSPRPLRIFFFWSGIIATIAYRIIIVLEHYAPNWINPVWYVGTIGFIIYFWHRYRVADKKSDLVKDLDLVKAVDESNIEGEDRDAIRYIVKTAKTSRAKWNSFIIFILSVVALIVGIIIDFIV